MDLGPQSLVFLRLIGGACGLIAVVSGFLRFRSRELSRAEAALRWLFGLSLMVVSIYPDSANLLVAMLALESAAYGRMLALLVLSSLLLWILLLRERGKFFALSRNLDRFIRSYALSRETGGELAKLMGTQILVALPAYNEARNIGSVLDRIPKVLRERRVGVVVIDDGSDDETAEVAQRRGHAVVSNPLRRGQGAALRLAYDIARHIAAEVVTTMDADGQHLPEELVRLVGPILDDDKDFVIGSRLLGARQAGSRVRLVGIYLNNALINLLAGTRVSDCSSGFKAIRVAALSRIDLAEDQFQAAEAIFGAAYAGLRIGEVPITVRQRATGESKKGRNLTYGLNFARSVMKSWWR
jgi:hypothetical protein